MKKFLYIVTILSAFITYGQDYQLFADGSSGKVQLKWMSKKINPNSSFDILKNENGAWKKVNSQAIVPAPVISISELNSPKNTFKGDKSYEFYIKNKNSNETNPNKRAYEAYQLALASIFDNQVAKHLGIYFEDAEVIIGKSYTYKLVQSDTQTQVSISKAVVVGDALPAPTDVKAKQIKEQVQLAWEVNDEYFGYNVYKNEVKINSEPIMANAVNGKYTVNYTEENLKPGNYNYTIKGVSFLNNETKPSTAVTVVFKDATPPSAVKDFKATRNNLEVQLTWKPSSDTDIKGYQVYKSTDLGKTFVKITKETVLEAKFTEIIEKGISGTLQYKVEVVDENWNTTLSMPTAVFVPDTNAPEKPNDLKGTPERGKITLNWRANMEKDLAGYRIYRGLQDDDENEMLLLNVTPQTNTIFVDTFYEKAGTKFIYKVAAIDKSFNESEKALVWVQLPDVIPPSAPFLKEGKIDNGQIVLNWEPLRTDAIAGYEVYRWNDDKEEKISRELITGTTFSQAIKVRGVLEYYIKAVDSAKLVSSPSNKIAVTTADEKIDFAIRLNQDVATKKVVVKLIGIKPEEASQILVFRKSGIGGFTLVPAQFRADEFKDENTQENVIYEYFVEVILSDDSRVRSEKQSINNAY